MPAKHRPSRAARQQTAKDTFNLAWTYLRRRSRSAEDTERMIDAAHASRHFWLEFGTPNHHAVSEWQLSRVYAVAGNAERSLHYARRCLAVCKANKIGDWRLAYAHEALARAAIVGGKKTAARAHLRRAQVAGKRIAAREDREHFLDDLEETANLLGSKRRR